MKSRTQIRCRKALSQVVSTLIILVVSVIMAGGTVTYYSIAVTNSSMKQEQLAIDRSHIWANYSGAQAAFVVENIGGRDALIDAVEVRYIEIPWESVYYASAVEGTLTPSQGLNITGSFNHTVGGTELSFTQASGSIVLPVGEGIILYIDQPDSLDINHIGTITTIVVYTSSNQYIALVEVEIA